MTRVYSVVNRLNIIMLSILLLSACGMLPTVGNDPTITWTAPSTACDGTALSGPVTYNVYAALLPAGIPTLTTPATEIPCGARVIVDRTKATPLNSAPLTVLTFQATLADGSYQIGVEALNAAGSQSAVTTTSATVKGRPGPATGITVGP